MPGPRFPNGYPKYFHDIAARLTLERPAKLIVDMPMQSAYARSHFNYFRQSWLRYYEFLKKQKDNEGALKALDMYNRLASYSVQISPPSTILFVSKEISVDINMRSEGKIETEMQSWLPKLEDIKQHRQVTGDTTELEKELWKIQQKDMESAAIKALGLKGKGAKQEQVIPDNPPTSPQGIPLGPPKGFEHLK